MALDYTSRGLLACGLMLASSIALAQSSIFTCTAGGRSYSGDRPPPECGNSDVRELNRDGSLKRLITRPPTPEEQRLRTLETQRKIEEDERSLAQRRRDRALLETYASEEEIEGARKKALSFSDQTVQRSNERIENFRKDRVKLDEEREFYRKSAMPESLKRSYALNDQLVKAEQKIIADANADRDRINARYDIDAKRFHELVLEGSHPAQR